MPPYALRAGSCLLLGPCLAPPRVTQDDEARPAAGQQARGGGHGGGAAAARAAAGANGVRALPSFGTWRSSGQPQSAGQHAQPPSRPVASLKLRATLAAAPPGATEAVVAAARAALAPHVLEHGRHILAASVYQPGLFTYELPGVGVLRYGLMHNGPELLRLLIPVVLGDPLCHPRNFGAISAAFLQQHPRAMFMQVSAAFARVLQEQCGLLVNSCGGETRLDIASYTFSGYAKRGLRSAIASAQKEGISVEEVMASGSCSSSSPHTSSSDAAAADWADVAREMQQVDTAWAARRGQHAARAWFLNRAAVFAPEPGVRKFVACDRTGRMLGFIFFDAVTERGRVTGWYANVTRLAPGAHPGALNLIIKTFLELVRAEHQLAAPERKLSVKRSLRCKMEAAAAAAAGEAAGGGAAAKASAGGGGGISNTASAAAPAADAAAPAAPFLSLGLSPLHAMDDGAFKHSPLVRRFCDIAYARGTAFYPFASLAAGKAKYGGGMAGGRYADPAVSYRQAYLAHSHHGTAAAMAAMFDLAKLQGYWDHPLDAASRYAALTASKALATLRQRKGGGAGGGAGLSRSSSFARSFGSSAGSVSSGGGSDADSNSPAEPAAGSQEGGGGVRKAALMRTASADKAARIVPPTAAQLAAASPLGSDNGGSSSSSSGRSLIRAAPAGGGCGEISECNDSSCTAWSAGGASAGGASPPGSSFGINSGGGGSGGSN